jgi:hypothetical protein
MGDGGRYVDWRPSVYEGVEGEPVDIQPIEVMIKSKGLDHEICLVTRS